LQWLTAPLAACKSEVIFNLGHRITLKKQQRHWLDLAEYASLVGLGVGSVASLVSQQAILASAPLSLLVLLNLANRRRFEQQMRLNTSMAVHEMDQKLSKNVELLNQQVMALPTPEAMGSLKKSLLMKNREVIEQLSSEIEGIQREMLDRLTVLEQDNLGAFRQELGQIQTQHSQLCDSVAYLTTQLNELSSSTRMDELEGAIARLRGDAMKIRDNLQALADQTRPSLNSLQDQINHLNRQLQKLPPPFDSTALRQEVAELIRVVADLVPKRDWNNLLSEIRNLQEQQETRNQSEESLRRKIQELNQQIQGRPVKANLTTLQNQINHLNRQFKKLPPPFDPSSLKREVAELMKAVASLVPKRDWNALVAQIKALQEQQEFQKQVESTLRRELEDLSQQLQTFANAPAIANPPAIAPVESAVLEQDEPTLPELNLTPPQQAFQSRIEDILNRELQALDQQLRALPSHPELQMQLEDTLQRELLEINEQLRAFPAGPKYELVFDFETAPSYSDTASSSRAVLEEALDVTQERLVLIWPWSSHCNLDDALLQKLEAFLAGGGQLDLGWCHTVHRNEERFLSPINQRWSISAMQQGLQTTLQKLLQLKRTSPTHFQFKILGTGENFLVSDESFTVLGIDEALTATTVFPEMELKLRTDDAEVIQQCIQRFENPVLHPNDVNAHWNRAVTRYDLGDRDGALEDFNQVLAVNPNDAIAYNYRGLVHYDLGHQAEAMADFNRSLEINPHQLSAYCNRGFIRSEQGDQLGAISDYSLALQKQPESAIAYFYRAMACQKYNDPLAAVSDFSEAIQLMPNSPISYYYRGQAYQKLENIQGAIADFELAAKLFTDRGNKTNAQKALRSLAKLKQLQAKLSATRAIEPPVSSTAESPSLVTLLEESGFVPGANEMNLSVGVPPTEAIAAPPAESVDQPAMASEAPELPFATASINPVDNNAMGDDTVMPVVQAELEVNGKAQSIHYDEFPPTDTPAASASKSALENGLTTIENLSNFFYSADPTVGSNGTIATPTEAGAKARAEASLMLGDRPDETLADFCKRF
jgi:tetratricopeptide (TPR) repeat protein